MSKVSVCLSTDLISHHGDLSNKTVVVIDILRASTCMLTAFMEGADEIRVFDDAKACFEMKSKGYMIAGERDGKKLEGFDLGNSPYDYLNAETKGEKIAITTTNGTKALFASKGAREVLIGSFLNVSALNAYLLQKRSEILLFCAGWKGRPNTEDTLFAGMLISKLIEYNYGLDGDEALLSLDFYLKNKNDLSRIINSSAHARRLSAISDISADLEFCSRTDLCSLVPVFKNDVIKCL